MTAQLGAHEVMEVHEVLSSAINAINQCQLYRPHVQDQHLASMVDHQLQFMIQEYNNLVQAVNQKGISMGSPYRSQSMQNFQPTYGLDNPQVQSPNMSPYQLNDSDIASGVLGIHKVGAAFKMLATLECADPNLRHMIQQGAINCAEQAYEVWQYMNQKGFYQVPTMKEMTTNTIASSYSPATGANVMGTSMKNPNMQM